MAMLDRASKGFTIVELLIVIVVIAILAAISIVAYTGVQQRATNAAIIDTASKSLGAFQTYVAANNTYPLADGQIGCVTTTVGCTDDQGGAIASNPSFDAAMATIASLPKSVPAVATDRKGVYFIRNSGITVDGVSKQIIMAYYLSGINQNCGLGSVLQYNWPNIPLSTTGYTYTYTGTTYCWISVPV